jgi:hypothetical protein
LIKKLPLRSAIFLYLIKRLPLLVYAPEAGASSTTSSFLLHKREPQNIEQKMSNIEVKNSCLLYASVLVEEEVGTSGVDFLRY